MTRLLNTLIKQFRRMVWVILNLSKIIDGYKYASNWRAPLDGSTGVEFPVVGSPEDASDNPLINFFYSHKEGRGLTKWTHYFDIYHRHLKKYIGREVHILEIGVHSGGSLEMWKNYFGHQAHIYGLDIEESCRKYSNPQNNIEVFIGSQGDKAFWKSFKEKIPAIDVIIDDGSHNADDQIITLEEMLPHLRPGGVYVCEDNKRIMNGFTWYFTGLAMNLNAVQTVKSSGMAYSDDRCVISATNFQQHVSSVHMYPYVAVIERSQLAVKEFRALKRGNVWNTVQYRAGKGGDKNKETKQA